MKIKNLFLSTILMIFLSIVSCLNAQTATPPEGDGSAQNPYQIATLENLYWLTQNSNQWNKQFIQTADINAHDSKNWDKGKGFSPIGSESNPFTGYYNGNDHTIENVTINRTNTDYIGVFGYVSGGALTIENLGVTDANVGGRNFTGILIGANYHSGTTVSNCYTTGSVTGHDEVGGLIGRTRYGSITENCYSSADVSSDYARAGGLVGHNRTETTLIRYCYSTGNVTAETGAYFNFGGLVGHNEGSITDSYSSASVTANDAGTTKLGGLSGGGGTVDNCYSTGAVSGSTSDKYGLTANGTVTDSFWDTETSGISNGGEGTGKTTAEMKTQSTFTNAGWDFDNIWIMNTQGNGYPALRNNVGIDMNFIPVAKAGNDQTIIDLDGNGSENVELDGSDSYDVNGSIVNYIWKENNTEIATEAITQVTLELGLHQITLEVTDNQGATNTDTVLIRVINKEQRAFPGAEGGGAYTAGGRGGAVIEVTNLNSSGPGSFREACLTTGARTIVFKVGGTIDLGGDVINMGPEHSNVTIAGQTAPGGGIQIKKGLLKMTGVNQVIIRYMRFRVGPISGNQDALNITECNDVIVDHVSCYWGIDETVDLGTNQNMTFQWSIVAEGLHESLYDEPESYDPYNPGADTLYWAHSRGIMITYKAKHNSIHHNLIYNNYKRNPLIQNSEAEVINNVMVNIYSKENVVSTKSDFTTRVNWIGNYFRFHSSNHAPIRTYNIASNPNSGCYYKDNYDAIYRPDSSYPETAIRVNESGKIIEPSTPFDFNNYPITTQPVQKAYQLVLDKAGATLPYRDDADKRIVAGISSGAAPSTLVNAPDEVGGWPVLNGGTPPKDSDHDGMADDWEIENGLDTTNASDRNDTTLSSDGYTNLEMYLEYLIHNPTVSVENNKNEISDKFELKQNYPNPFNPTTKISFSIPKATNVELSVFNILGQKVATLVNKELGAGSYKYNFDASNLTSGIYFYKLQANEYSSVKKMMLVK